MSGEEVGGLQLPAGHSMRSSGHMVCAGLEPFQEEASEGRAAICVQEVRKEGVSQCHTGRDPWQEERDDPETGRCCGMISPWRKVGQAGELGGGQGPCLRLRQPWNGKGSSLSSPPSRLGFGPGQGGTLASPLPSGG